MSDAIFGLGLGHIWEEQVCAPYCPFYTEEGIQDCPHEESARVKACEEARERYIKDKKESKNGNE